MQEEHTTKAALLASVSDDPVRQDAELYDALCDVRDIIRIVEMASEKLNRSDGGAFLTTLDVVQHRLKAAMGLIDVRGVCHDN